jgi:pimeloyl-ACP methyl ester carboxylesterase
MDGTGRLLHRQPQLHEAYRVCCLAMPQDAVHTYSDLANQVIEALQQQGPSILLAESFGGAVALLAALERPDLVQRLLLVNTFAYYPRQAFVQLCAGLGSWLPARPGHPATRPLRGFFFFSPEVSAAEREQWWERTADVPMHVFGRRIRLIAGLDLRPRLHEIHTPTLVIAGRHDRLVHPSAGHTLARRLPNARLLRPRVAHAALIHPLINVAELLREPRYWPALNAAPTAAVALASRSE